ncbi:MAG: hypothetical protein IPL39_18005 [Opitutaceae bacterium]|nr:hypothetical protein [Opitutaceae bacterium]
MSLRAAKTDNLLTKILATGNGWWKKNILFAPQNWIRFDFNNLVSDGEKAFTSDPGMLRELIPAGKEVYKFLTSDPTAGADVREAFRLGVLDTLTAAEVNALRAQRPFEAWETTTEHHMRVAVNRLTSFFTSSRWNTMGWSKLREATFRYAKYQADLKRMRNGASPAYGGAYWKNVEAIQRTGAPENIHEENCTGRGMGRQGPGSGSIMSATPYVLKWREAGLRREEAYATIDQRAKKRQELETQQAEADRALTARKAAAISRATFGDYGELTPNGNAIRKLVVPFFAWTEVNFRYHANLFRNLRDQLRSGDIETGTAARRLAGQAAALGTRAAMGTSLRLAIPYIAVTAWNALMFGDDEDKLSEEDKRRFHLLLGSDEEGGKVRVIYLNTAFTDVLKWFSGNRAAQLTTEVLAGRTDWQTAAGEFAGSVPRDFANNTLGSMGPVVKVPYTLISEKSTFPDVTDQRTIPSYDMRRVIFGQVTDQVTAELIEMAINQDFVPTRSVGEWAQQAILQVRRRDPESWAFYAIKDKAATFEEEKTGKKDARSAYDAPDAQVLKAFRRAIFKGDVAEASRAYQRLLTFGYTAERFESSVRAQDPLYGIPKAMRREFVEGLAPHEQEQLRRAYRYYLRMQEMEGAGRQLFPKRGIPERARDRFLQRDRTGVLANEIERALATQGNEAEIERRTDWELQQAMRRN